MGWVRSMWRKAADLVAAHPTGAHLPIVMTVIGGETIYPAV